jgi:hypothetical protein
MYSENLFNPSQVTDKLYHTKWYRVQYLNMNGNYNFSGDRQKLAYTGIRARRP